MPLEKIFHISDIHIRNYIRHNEYEGVFENLFEYIEKNKTENSIIFLGGDIAHSKNDVSPELIQMICKLLRNCTDLCTTILIAGNHDCNLNNQGRLDVLTPIVDSLCIPNLFYWRDNGLYDLPNYPELQFNVFSVFTGPHKWIPISEMDNTKTKIVLHHGAVNGSKTDLKHDIVNDQVNIELFKGADLVLLGDIHKFQYLNEEQTIGYSSSLIQQNFGETLDKHGLIEWDVINRKPNFVEIRNEYGYYTFYVIDDVIQNPIPFWTDNLKIKIRHENTQSKTLVKLLKEINKNTNVIELIQEKLQKNKLDYRSVNFELGDIRDIEYQNNLFETYINEKYPELSKEDIDTLRHINREVNSNISTSNTTLRHITWKPIRLEFDNMFSFGEGNIIDFQNFTGNIGIFSPNASGKSSVLSVLTFCLFDKCEKTSKAIHVLNNTANQFSCKLEVELQGKRYIVERTGVKNKKSLNVPVQVKFFRKDNDNIVDLTGQERDDTNKIIRDHFGTYEDFVMTSLSSQIGTQSFIDRTNKQRKELLYQFLDISLFDDLYNICKERIRNNQVIIKDIENRINFNQNDDLKNNISFWEQQKISLNKTLEKLNIEQQNIENDINLKLKQIVPQWKKLRSLEEIQKEIDSQVINEQKLNEELLHWINLLENKKTLTKYLELTSLEREYQTLFKDDSYKLTQEKSRLKLELSTLKLKIENDSTLVKRLGEHKYDPNCEYCIQNPFVKDAQEAEKRLGKYQTQKTKLDGEYAIVTNDIKNNDANVNKNSLINEKKSKLQNHLSEIESLEQKILLTTSSITNYNEKIQILNNELKLSQEHQEELRNNIQLERELKTKQQEQITVKNQITDVNKEISELEYKLRSSLETIKNNDIEILRYTQLKDITRIYEYYLNIVNRNGIPYDILRKVLPVIEMEVNSILHHMVEFQIRFETTEDFYINSYIVYGEEKQWPIEMVSGMERFILTLALRTALLEITSLPKTNFMAIDEGFGVLDTENMSSLYLLFEMLRQKFEFVLSVSHNDTMKDMMDDTIKIEKVNNKSRIVLI